MASCRSGQAPPPAPPSQARRAAESRTARAACGGATSVAGGLQSRAAAMKPGACSRPASLVRRKQRLVPSCSPQVQNAQRVIMAQTRAQSSGPEASNLSVLLQSPSQQPLAASPRTAATSSKPAYTPLPRRTVPCSTQLGQAEEAGASAASSSWPTARSDTASSAAKMGVLEQAWRAASAASAAASSTVLLQLAHKASLSTPSAACASASLPARSSASASLFANFSWPPAFSRPHSSRSPFSLASSSWHCWALAFSSPEASSCARSSESCSSHEPPVGAGHFGTGGQSLQALHLGQEGQACGGGLGSSTPNAPSASPT
mmetsp:Transcript_36145/g.103967  ORF Transcript_36145/g.103967 Transcript_36145/m.103967 type:complete len:318 (+) Transcript_36145:326-1279(+)